MKDIYQQSAPDQRAAYQIKVWGRLSADWSEWLNGVTITPEDDATIIDAMVDQAALRGILCQIWDLNLTLVTVTRIETGAIQREKEQETWVTQFDHSEN
jgi:hypothetical protein